MRDRWIDTFVVLGEALPMIAAVVMFVLMATGVWFR